MFLSNREQTYTATPHSIMFNKFFGSTKKEEKSDFEIEEDDGKYYAVKQARASCICNLICVLFVIYFYLCGCLNLFYRRGYDVCG